MYVIDASSNLESLTYVSLVFLAAVFVFLLVSVWFLIYQH